MTGVQTCALPISLGLYNIVLIIRHETMTNNSSNNTPVYESFILNHEWHSGVVGFFIGILMIVIYLWMAAGFINLLVNLYNAYPDNWSRGAEVMIKDVVIILAALELIRVLQAYLLMGRVKVTFILDVTRSEERRVGKECRSRWSTDH